MGMYVHVCAIVTDESTQDKDIHCIIRAIHLMETENNMVIGE